MQAEAWECQLAHVTREALAVVAGFPSASPNALVTHIGVREACRSVRSLSGCSRPSLAEAVGSVYLFAWCQAAHSSRLSRMRMAQSGVRSLQLAAAYASASSPPCANCLKLSRSSVSTG